ncbi:MAG TPA: DUF1292 domain-containing protein [Firmicutes bacterium]|nr:DUF1292 domain-containing protein [Bacillota bacterium]
MTNQDDRKSSPMDDDEELLYDDMVVLTDEEGNEETFRILMDDLFVQDRQYVVLMPVDNEANLEPELVILRVETLDEGETTLVTIDSDDEWEDVLRAFEEIDIEDSLGEYEIEIEDYDEEDDEKEPEA